MAKLEQAGVFTHLAKLLCETAIRLRLTREPPLGDSGHPVTAAHVPAPLLLDRDGMVHVFMIYEEHEGDSELVALMHEAMSGLRGSCGEA